MPQLTDKIALVTGGASGIGAACARRLVAEGATVVITDVQDPMGEALAAELGAPSFYLHHDVTSEEAWIEVIGVVKHDFGRLDVVVNNAGIAISSLSIADMRLSDFQRQQAVNVDGVFLGCKHALPLMREAGNGGSIINMSSVAGLKGSPTLAAYSATKGAVRMFTKAVALECAAARDRVRVNSVHPGIIETPIWNSIYEAGDHGQNAPPDLDTLSTIAVPLGVKGAPDDIAAGVIWLASAESRYVTGAELVIDGGYSIR